MQTQRAFRRDQGQQRRDRRAFEGAGHAEHEGRDEDMDLAQPAAIRAPTQKQRGGGFRQLAKLHDAFALETIGGVPRDKDQKRGGEELHQPNHAELEGAAGQVETDGDAGLVDRHLEADAAAIDAAAAEIAARLDQIDSQQWQSMVAGRCEGAEGGNRPPATAAR